jgi:hypothetical protein
VFVFVLFLHCLHRCDAFVIVIDCLQSITGFNMVSSGGAQDGVSHGTPVVRATEVRYIGILF